MYPLHYKAILLLGGVNELRSIVVKFGIIEVYCSAHFEILVNKFAQSTKFLAENYASAEKSSREFSRQVNVWWDP